MTNKGSVIKTAAGTVAHLFFYYIIPRLLN